MFKIILAQKYKKFATQTLKDFFFMNPIDIIPQIFSLQNDIYAKKNIYFCGEKSVQILTA